MTSIAYDDLIAVATVGVSRRPVAIGGLAGPAGEHAGVLDHGDPAAAVLDAAALLGAARRAGVLPTPGVACPGPAGPDTAPELPARAGEMLAEVRTDPVLLADLLTGAARAGYRAPAPLLPALLDAAVRHASLRPSVAAVLGARGRWLASYRADWQKVMDAVAPEVPGDPGVWETGSRGERRGYLARLRERNPAAARDLLAAGWARETGEDRADLLGVLADGLSTADEEFLETALDDRKAAVREAAGRLLARLPGSGFSRRAAARAASLLRVERSGLRRRLVVRLPDAAEASAVRDGTQPRPPSPAIGARAWLVTQLIAAAPLAGWVIHFGLAPAQIVSLPVEGNLAADVHAGWRIAAISQATPEWAEALLATGEPARAGKRPPAAWPQDHQLAAVLPPTARAARAAGLLAKAPAAPATITEVTSCQPPWPESLASAVIAALQGAVASARVPRSPVALVTAAARGLPATGPTDYAVTLARLAEAGFCPPTWSGPLRFAADTVALRRAFLEEIR